jgi:hypothetical protein
LLVDTGEGERRLAIARHSPEQLGKRRVGASVRIPLRLTSRERVGFLGAAQAAEDLEAHDQRDRLSP